MKNFLRSLRSAWPYRARLVVSIVCAVCAAAFWGLTFTAIKPVLEILQQEKNLQTLIQEAINDANALVAQRQAEVDKEREEEKKLDDMPPGYARDKRARDLARRLASLEGKLENLRSNLKYYHIAKKYIDAYLPADTFLTLAWVIGFVVLCIAAKGVFEFGQESLVGSVVNLSLLDLRNRLYRNVIHLDVNHFGEEGTHELLARFTNDTELLGTGIKTLFGKIIAEPLKALSCVAWACLISWQLTFMFLILVPVALFVLTKVGRLMKRATRKLLERMSTIYKILQETFQGIRVVKAFAMEPYERRRFGRATRAYYDKAMWVVNLDALAGPIVEVLGVAAIAGALLVGAWMVLSGQTEVLRIPLADQRLEGTDLLTLYGLLAAIADPVRKLSSVYTRLQSGAAAADRVFAYIDRQPRVQANARGLRLPRHRRDIEFRDVCFSYVPERPTLTNINLHIPFGETVALVGKNGCGKSTLMSLIPRFFDPDHGSVFIDGHELRRANLRSLRKQIGLVTQDTILFDDTVYNNIAYGSRGATRDQVEAAARRAFAHDFIGKLPLGYDTRVGEMAGKLSGGQRQRLALARAILRDPAILILDEFTSQCDPVDEPEIHRALREFARGRTTFLITHRLNTLEIATRIVVVEAGRIAAVGTHAELLATCPVFQRLNEGYTQRLVA